MSVGLGVGDRVRVHRSGETGRIARVVQAADGRPTFEIEFDSTPPGGAGGGRSGESGGLYVPEDVEPID
jgi:hypothetical protein